MKIPLELRKKKDEKKQRKTTLDDFAYFQAIEVCQMLYIDAMFRKTGYGSTFTLTSNSHQMLLLLRFQGKTNIIHRCISLNIAISSTTTYFVESICVCIAKNICELYTIAAAAAAAVMSRTTFEQNKFQSNLK